MIEKTGLVVVGEGVTERCDTCRFWFDDLRDGWPGDEKSFEHAPCRRYPPRARLPGERDGPGLPVSHAPLTLACDWCGEWRPKQGGK